MKDTCQFGCNFLGWFSVMLCSCAVYIQLYGMQHNRKLELILRVAACWGSQPVALSSGVNLETLDERYIRRGSFITGVFLLFSPPFGSVESWTRRDSLLLNIWFVSRMIHTVIIHLQDPPVEASRSLEPLAPFNTFYHFIDPVFVEGLRLLIIKLMRWTKSIGNGSGPKNLFHLLLFVIWRKSVSRVIFYVNALGLSERK